MRWRKRLGPERDYTYFISPPSRRQSQDDVCLLNFFSFCNLFIPHRFSTFGLTALVPIRPDPTLSINLIEQLTRAKGLHTESTLKAK